MTHICLIKVTTVLHCYVIRFQINGHHDIAYTPCSFFSLMINDPHISSHFLIYLPFSGFIVGYTFFAHFLKELFVGTKRNLLDDVT